MTGKETTTNQVRGERGQDRGREIGAIAVEVEIDVEEVEVEIEKGVIEVVAEIETGRTKITTEEVAEGIEIGYDERGGRNGKGDIYCHGILLLLV